MAVEMSGTYTGELKMELRHAPSGATLATAAPRDNLGDGSSFSPTDLLAASLGSCMVTTMAIVAQREGIAFEGASFSLEKHMRSDPRRVDAVPVRIHLPASLGEAQRRKLENAALTCPVHRSLHPDIRKDVEFVYE
ncbi:MAG TPA: OsmC family protein [Longimicrobium sp.]|nr:OsmC family protein [Longimicrobium sp.]